MAIQGRGYYGIGASKKDFGFSSNLTLPLADGYKSPQKGGMPHEGHSGKGHSSFAVEKDEKVARGAEKKSKSWKKRLSGFFRKDKKKDKDLVRKGGGSASSGKAKAYLEEQPEKETSDNEIPAPADEVNDMILMQEGLTQDSDEHNSEEEMLVKELEEGPLDDEDSDLVVAEEVEVMYFDQGSADEKDPEASLTEDQKNSEDTELEVDNQLMMDTYVEQGDKELTSRVETDMITSPSEKQEKKKSSQNEPGPKEKVSSKQRKKKRKVENRKSTALEASAQNQDEDIGKKNGKTKKQRPKSMPVASLALAEELEMAKDDQEMTSSEPSEVVKRKSKVKQPTAGAAAPPTPSDDTKKSKLKQPKVDSTTSAGDTGARETVALTETHPETKKLKAKKVKEKNGAATKGQETKQSAESPVVKKKSTKAKQKAAASEETFDSPNSSAHSPPPIEEIQVPKQQVTVGVIKKKKQKTRPFLDVGGSPKSKVYQKEISGQKQGEDELDTEERELLHDMDTLQLMAEGAETTSEKKVKKKRQSHQDKAEPLAAQSEAATEIKGGKQSKVSKMKKSKERETEASEAHSPLQPQAVPEVDKKQTKMTKKTKSKEKVEKEVEAVVVQSPPESVATTEADKKKSKKTKKAKGKSEPEVLVEPEAQPSEAVAEVGKKQPKKTKKITKSKGKSEISLETEIQTPRQEEPKSSKKKSSKKTKSKEKLEETDAAALLQTPTKTEAVVDEKLKKKKKKMSISSVGSPESPSIHQQSDGGSSSNRGSRSQLVSKTSKSKIASEESDDLVWIGAEKLSKKKSKSKVASKDDTAVGEEPEAMNLSSSSRSTSYHELSKEERKTFREELRMASSQHSVDASEGEGSVKVEIDPNVKVTKSGVVKGGKGSRRPSIQVDFTGSGIEQTDSASPNEGEKGSVIRDKKVSMDLSAVPQTTPSLGLTHGHDKLELVNRSSTKRRPMSMRESVLLTKGEEAQGGTGSPPQNHILAAHINKLQKTAGSSNTGGQRHSASLVYQAAVAKSQQREAGSGYGMPVSRQLFPSAHVTDGEPQSGEGSATSTLERSRRNKTVDKPVKTLGIASENTSGNGSSPSAPSWVALAMNKQKRSSLLLAEQNEEKNSFSAVSSPPASAQSTTPSTTTTAIASGGGRGRQGTDSTIPKMGTVQARLAAFERK